jgi:hypothetical protein
MALEAETGLGELYFPIKTNLYRPTQKGCTSCKQIGLLPDPKKKRTSVELHRD